MRQVLIKAVAVAAVALLAASGCSESGRDPSPVEIVVTATVANPVYDLAVPLAQQPEVADILVRAFTKNPSGTNGDLNDVRLTAYRVTYRRTDGGNTVPASFVVSSGQLVTTNGTAVSLNAFRAIEPSALTQAPFASLLPQNGGRDPVTGRTSVSLDVAVEVYGETLAGERVYDFTVFPLDFCYGCTLG